MNAPAPPDGLRSALLARLRRMLRPPRRVLPTRAGMFVLAAPILLGVAAVSASNNLLFMLLGASLGAIVLSGVLSEANLRGVQVRVRALGRVHAQEPARLLVELVRPEPEARRDAYGLRVRELQGSGWRFWALRPGGLDAHCDQLSGPRAEVLTSRTFERRGPARLRLCELATRFPFGLLDKSRDVDVELQVLVRPRRVPLPPLLREPGGGADDGDASARRGHGLEVQGIRERSDRDAWHRVHALRSLALGREVVLETSGAERPLARLGIASPEGSDPEALERTLELAQAALESWEARGWAVDLVTLRESLPAVATSLEARLDAIAALTPGGGPMPGERSGRALWLVPEGARPPEGALRWCSVDARGGLRPRGRA